MTDINFPFRNAALSGVRLLANQIIPLLALPFTLAMVGSEAFGMIVFTQAIAWYFVVLVEYGFNLTAVRAVAVGREDAHEVRRLLYDVLGSKLLLLCVSLIAVVAISAAFFGVSSGNTTFLLIAMVLALGAALQPVWLFQGLQEFGLISVVQVSSRLACFGGVFIFVRNPGDAYLAQFLMALPYCVNAVVLLPVAIRRFGGPPRRRVKEWAAACVATLRDGFDVFVGQLSTTLFSSTTTVLSGAVLGVTFAGYYGIAERLIRGVAMLTTPISEALYPRLAGVLASGSKSERRDAFALITKVLGVVGSALALAGAAIIATSDSIASVVSSEGDGMREIATTLSWLAFIPLLIFINNIFGVQLLLGLGKKRLYRNAVLFSGLLIPALGMALPNILGFAGFPIALLVGELVLAFLTYWFAVRFTEFGRNYATPS